MSLNVSNVLNLPCLRQAAVVGGKRGLSRAVATVSVLEYAEVDDVQERLFNSVVLGDELVISCFAALRGDVDTQCAMLRRLAEAGEAGLVLFYVGVVLKRVDNRLAELADELAFPLIVMPRNNVKLRYSEVISDVMFAIFQDQMSQTQFKDDILERLSRLPFYQRSIDTALRLLSDRAKATLLVTDAADNLLNAAHYPRSYELDAAAAIASGKYSARRAIRTAQGALLNLYVMTPDGAVNNDDTAQIAEVLRMSLNMWGHSHTEMILPELVKAILQDEPIKMRRISAAFNIGVESINSMMLVTPTGGDVAAPDKILSTLKRELVPLCSTIVVDIYNGEAVAFIDTSEHGDFPSLAAELAETLEAEGAPAVITLAMNLPDTTTVRRVYLAAQNALAAARQIYPARKVLTHHDVLFAEECRAIIEQGEQAVCANTAALDCLNTGDPVFSEDLLETLTVYLLDSDGSMPDCARRLFIHLNSAKYRVKRAGERLGFKVGRLPETFEVYRAVALRRLLIVQKDNMKP